MQRIKLGKSRVSCVYSFLLTVIAIAVPDPALGIQGGELALGNPLIVSWLENGTTRSSSCSAGLLRERIVVTAAHCVTQQDSTQLNAGWENSWVAMPGVDIRSDDVTTRVKVVRIIRAPNYIDVWQPDKGDTRTQVDDIAFLFLEKPLVSGYSVSVATMEEVAVIKSQRSEITHLGYGWQNRTGHDGKPYQIVLKANSRGRARYGDTYGVDWKTISTEETGTKAVCGGDSGSPWYSLLNGTIKLVAVTVAATGCLGTGLGGTLGTVIAPYLPLLDAEWEIFRISESAATTTTTTTTTTNAIKNKSDAKASRLKNLLGQKCFSLGSKRKMVKTIITCKYVSKNLIWSR